MSVRENQLIIEYGTQNSKYQKAIGGGQVWTYEKWFVRNNGDNPKFLRMSEIEIESWIADERAIDVYLDNFVNNMKNPVDVYLSSFVGNMKKHLTNT